METFDEAALDACDKAWDGVTDNSDYCMILTILRELGWELVRKGE